MRAQVLTSLGDSVQRFIFLVSLSLSDAVPLSLHAVYQAFAVIHLRASVGLSSLTRCCQFATDCLTSLLVPIRHTLHAGAITSGT